MILLSLKKIKEKLLANISYNLYILYRYQTIKNINFNVDGNDKQNQSTDQSVEQYFDFEFILREMYFKIKNNDDKKFWITDYFEILNITISNGSDNTVILYDKNLDQLLNEVDNDKGRSNNNFRYISANNDSSDEYRRKGYLFLLIKNIFILI
jgi:uncharacterized protein YabE (DUF348 family)